MKDIRYNNLLLIVIFPAFMACSPSKHEQESNPSELITKTLSNSDFVWIATSTDYFDIYSLERSYASENIEKLKTGLLSASKTILDRFELIKPEEKTTIFFVSSREQMQQLVGHPAGGWAAVRDNAIFYVIKKENNPQLKHELGHLYTWTNWGNPYHNWLSEGMAVLSSGNCKDENFHAWAALLKRTKDLSPINAFELQEFDFSKIQPHLQAASLLIYIEENYGTEALQKVWKKGLIKWTEESGKDINQFEEAWHELLNKPEYNKPHLKLEKPFFCE